MATAIEWYMSDNKVYYHAKDDPNMVVATVDFTGPSQLVFTVAVQMMLPIGIMYTVLLNDLETANWLAVAIASHNGV